jgi:hypothetical protein
MRKRQNYLLPDGSLRRDTQGQPVEQYLYNITHFPTAAYTLFLGFVLVYWLLSIVGAVDIDTLDIDVDIETDVDASAISGLTGFMLTFGLTGVPISVIISVWSLYAWLISYFAVEYLLMLLPSGILHALGALAVLVGSFFVSIPLVAQTIKPLKGLFTTHTAIRKTELVGRLCTVRTMSVTDDFGQGEMHDGEAGMILDIRAPQPNSIKKNDKVIIIAYNAERATFDVVPEAEFR